MASACIQVYRQLKKDIAMVNRTVALSVNRRVEKWKENRCKLREN